jgi:hypothetical protein
MSQHFSYQHRGKKHAPSLHAIASGLIFEFNSHRTQYSHNKGTYRYEDDRLFKTI